MFRKLLHLFVPLLVIIGLLGTSIAVSAQPQNFVYEPYDAGLELRDWEPTPDRIVAPTEDLLKKAEAAGNQAEGSPLTVLDTKLFLSLDDYNGYYFFDWFHLVANGTDAQIWVQADLSWPTSDPRDIPLITQEQVDYLLDEFQTNMHPIETSYFGPPDLHDGSFSLLEAWGHVPPGYYNDTAGRQLVLVSNIRDDNYYDPDYRLYIAGFYSSSLEAYFDRNTMSIDAYDWANRVGPDVERPNLYEGIFAHEYQHLLHDDYDPAEENWINEGLSDWAEWLCGYGIPDSHVEDLAAMPENSLVAWGDQGDLEILADYGIAYMYQEYMFEQYGPPFIQGVFSDGVNQGIASVDAVLSSLSVAESFADTFHDFSVALYTTGAFTLEELARFQVDVGYPAKPNPEAFITDGAPAWGTDYHILWGYQQIVGMTFSGMQFNPTAWTSDGDVLWSGTGDLTDNWAIFEATGGGNLSFDTYMDIEDYWDFGFVQVSTDGGHTWTSLSNAYTTSDHDPSAHPNIVANLPGLTGWSGDWMPMTFDLSAYSGDILIGFRYMTDWATPYDGWYIDDVYVDGTLISDGSSTDAFMDINEVLGITNEFTVTLIGESMRKGHPQYEVLTILTGDYIEEWESIRDLLQNCRYAILLVTYDAAQGVTAYVDYTIDMYYKSGRPVK
jgi:hypothetical protein